MSITDLEQLGDVIIFFAKVGIPIGIGWLGHLCSKYFTKIDTTITKINESITDIHSSMKVAETKFDQIEKDLVDLKKKVFHIGES